MHTNDKISCLVCCHSQDDFHDRLLARALYSLTKQTYKLDEIVLVLNKCWPDTMEMLNDFPYMEARESGFLKIYEKLDKTGLASAKNFGLKYCTGDWVSYCDADDAWLPCKLEVQRNYALNRTVCEAGTQNITEDEFVFCEAWDVYDAGGPNEVWKPNCFYIGQYEENFFIKRAIQNENVLCHGSALIRRQVLQKLGGYSELKEHLGKEDWELWQRAIKLGYRFYKVPERLYLYSMNTGVAR